MIILLLMVEKIDEGLLSVIIIRTVLARSLRSQRKGDVVASYFSLFMPLSLSPYDQFRNRLLMITPVNRRWLN